MNILILDNGQPFDLNTPYVKALGGSETSVLLLAKGLAELGHSVILLTSSTIDVPQYNTNIIVHNINKWSEVYNQANIVIFNRCIIPEILFSNDGKFKFYYSHDAYDQTHIVSILANREIYNRFVKILCVSKWQKDTFIKYLHIPESKLDVLGNSIDNILYSGYVKRDPYKLIFASIPYKGLEVLPDLFNDICIRSKLSNLSLDVYSSMKLYGVNDDSKYEIYFNKLSKIKGVTIYEPVSMTAMANVLMSSSLYIHPATYHETFGMMFVMAQAAGCLPVTINNGASSEVINNGVDGFIVNGKTIFNYECYNAFVDLVVDLLHRDLYKYRVNAEKSAEKWFYINIANKFIDILTNRR